MKRLIVSLFFIGFGSVVADSLNDLAWGLKSLSAVANDEPSLGVYLLKSHPEALIELDKEYSEKRDYKIYQLKALRQSGGECGIHAFRNALFMMDIFSSPRNDFEKIYQKMISEKEHEAFVKEVGCQRNAGTSFLNIFQMKHEINKGKIACIADCIPKDSAVYIKKLLNFMYYQHPIDGKIRKDLSSQTDFRKKLLDIIKEIEPSLYDTEKVVLDVSSLASPNSGGFFQLSRLVEPLRTFCTNSDGLLAFELAVWDGGIFGPGEVHGVALVAHKYNNKMEYIFADSNNSQLGRGLENFCSGVAVDRVMSLTQSLEYFNDTLVRFLYYSALFDKKHIKDFCNDFVKFDLKDNELYRSVYKVKFCELMRNELKDDRDYDVMRKSMGC